MVVAASQRPEAAPTTPAPCNWTQCLVALRRVGPWAETMGWTARKDGMTVEQFANTILAWRGEK